MTDAIRQLQKLRNLRAPRKVDLSIAAIVGGVATEAQRVHNRLGELQAIWEELVPAPLAAQTALTSLRGGVLHVKVESSSVAFEIDRLMRSGLLDALRKRYRSTVVRVKTRVK